MAALLPPPQPSPPFQKLQAQGVDKGLHFVGYFRRDVFLDFQEGAAVALAVLTLRPQLITEEPVGNVNVDITVFLRGN